MGDRDYSSVLGEGTIEPMDVGPPDPTPGDRWAAHACGVDAGWFRDPPPAQRWLLQRIEGAQRIGVLPRSIVGILAAAGGVGKTMGLVQLAIAVCTGGEWLGQFTVPPESMGRVLLMLGEEGATEIRRRLYNAAQLLNLGDYQIAQIADRLVIMPLAGCPVSLVEVDPSTRTARAGELAVDLAAYLARTGPWSLVIIDPLARFAGADTEKDNAAATVFVQTLETLLRAPGAPNVLVAHHTSQAGRVADRAEKASGVAAIRGVTGLSDAGRWSAIMEDRPANEEHGAPAYVLLTHAKSNYSAPWKPVVLLRAEGGALRPANPAERAAIDAARGVRRAGARVDNGAKVEGGRAAKSADDDRRDFMDDGWPE